MKTRCIVLLITGMCGAALSQQVEDPDFRYVISSPRYAGGAGTEVIIDEAHNNFHTASGRYKPFADLLRADGYLVKEGKSLFTEEYLESVRILVIANATDNRPWIAPTLSAFTGPEIDAVKAWVKKGGSLFLIADHMPMAGAASSLAASFGFTFYNGFAFRKDEAKTERFTRADQTLVPGELTNGNGGDERVDSVMCFTGQGFLAPSEATVILSLGTAYQVLMPDTAWRFNDQTPVVVSEKMVNGAYMTYGKGRLVVFGEAAMFTAQLAGPKRNKVGMNHPGARYNPRLLLNIVHWLDNQL